MSWTHAFPIHPIHPKRSLELTMGAVHFAALTRKVFHIRCADSGTAEGTEGMEASNGADRWPLPSTVESTSGFSQGPWKTHPVLVMGPEISSELPPQPSRQPQPHPLPSPLPPCLQLVLGLECPAPRIQTSTHTAQQEHGIDGKAPKMIEDREAAAKNPTHVV